MSDIFVPRLQYLGARKEMAELDKGGAGQDKAFWEDISIEFNDYSKDEYSELSLSSLSDKKIFSEKKVDPSCKSGKTSSWESLRKMFLSIQKDYKLKHQRYKLSGNHSNSFIDFCHGRLDTYYLHIWLSKRDPNLLESIVEELPDEVKFESNNRDNAVSNSSVSTGHSRHKKRKSAADVLERHLQMKTEAKSGLDALKSQKAAAYQLKSYCLGMNQLMELSGKNTANLSDEQNDLMARMKSTLGAAVNAMETHIKSGTVWCPTTVDDQQKTPKFSNSDNSKKKSRTSRSISSDDSAARKLINSGEKDDSGAADIDDLQKNITFEDEANNESNSTSPEGLLDTNDESQNSLDRSTDRSLDTLFGTDTNSYTSKDHEFMSCCAGSLCINKTDPDEFRVICRDCGEKAHVFCSRSVNDEGTVKTLCLQCIAIRKQKVNR
jgi:hypothetical protein